MDFKPKIQHCGQCTFVPPLREETSIDVRLMNISSTSFLTLYAPFAACVYLISLYFACCALWRPAGGLTRVASKWREADREGRQSGQSNGGKLGAWSLFERRGMGRATETMDSVI